jgi:DNA-binding FadR family transcriptional regulator
MVQGRMNEVMSSPQRLSTNVVDQLAERVRSGQYPVGSFFPSERELCEEFGVGRPAIREALVALQRAGLAELSPRQRPRAAKPTAGKILRELSGAAKFILDQPEGFAHFEQVRSFIEVSLARYAASHATNAQIARLGYCLEHNRQAVGREREFVETDVAFHRALADTAGNPIIMAMHDAFVEWLIMQRPEIVDVENRNRRTCEDHKEIFDAVLRRDAERAAAAMQRHMDNAYALYIADIHASMLK